MFIFLSVFFLNVVFITESFTILRTGQLPKINITIVGTNDIHGGAYPTLISRKDTGQRFNYGGLVYMARIIQILKQESNGNFIYLDAGDQFQGGFQASKLISSGQIISDYYNHVNMNGGVIGNHEFDFGPQFLNTYLNKLNQDILSANFVDQNTKKTPLQKQERSRLFSFPIKMQSPSISKGLTQIKVGVIGLTTIQTLTTTSGFIDHLFPATYTFEQYRDVVINQSAYLKAKGANSIILATHIGNGCTNNSTYGIWTIQNQKTIPCQKNDELFKLIDSLPAGTVSAIVQGHRHTTSHYFYKGIPIIGTINGGYYINSLKLTFTISGDKVYINPEDLSIEGPIPICQKIFLNTHKCEYVTPQNLNAAGPLVNWAFHGHPVYSDPELQSIFNTKWASKMEQYQFQIVNNFIPYPIGKNYEPNAPIGNLITNVMANAVSQDIQFDFVLLNGGGFRTTWYPGVIRYAQLHSMFPFDNTVVSFQISGADLKKTFKILQNGQKRFYPSWGLSQTLKLNSTTNQYDLTNLQLANGEIVQDETLYTGVSIGFLINGGDDFTKVLQAEVKIINEITYKVMMKQLIQGQLLKMGEITEDSLKNPSDLQRIIIQVQQQ